MNIKKQATADAAQEAKDKLDEIELEILKCESSYKAANEMKRNCLQRTGILVALRFSVSSQRKRKLESDLENLTFKQKKNTWSICLRGSEGDHKLESKPECMFLMSY